ncbi:unnamed protein product [Periconia digitata]|uniref:Uncharacterized protein n=1 Tax=Periconia digitata TaxID=1303443 RepID=A0A9W4UN57_9PLEO|nr:unnamed protein product [Periconia digitata]
MLHSSLHRLTPTPHHSPQVLHQPFSPLPPPTLSNSQSPLPHHPGKASTHIMEIDPPLTATTPQPDFQEIRQILDLKIYALSHARILYGSEARKFYDILDAPVAPNSMDTPGKFLAVLVCSLEGASKTLRIAYADEGPVHAVNKLVQELKRDSGVLYSTSYLFRFFSRSFFFFFFYVDVEVWRLLTLTVNV